MDRKTQTPVRLAAITVIVLASLLSAHADTYRISEIRGGSHSIDGVELRAGSTVSDLSRIVSRWDEDRGQSRYIKLYNLTTRRTQIIPAPVTKKSERGFWDKVVSYFSEIRKCSTRAPENELTGGLGESLSRTFYVMAGDPDTDITIASRLPVDDSRRLEASFNTPSGPVRAPRRGSRAARVSLRRHRIRRPSHTADSDRRLHRPHHRATADPERLDDRHRHFRIDSGTNYLHF